MAKLKKLITGKISEWKNKYEIYLIDGYRKHYGSYSFRYKKRKAQKWLRRYPEQAHFDFLPVTTWLENIVEKPVSVIEIGGWRGDLAALALSSYEFITMWHNYDLIENNQYQKCTDNRYRLVSLSDYIWNNSLDVEYNALIATHMIEHISWGEFTELVKWIPESVKTVLLEAPVPESAENHNWKGDYSSHIFEKGWEQIITEMANYRFTISYRHHNTLIFKR